jgi:hypothetical protein
MASTPVATITRSDLRNLSVPSEAAIKDVKYLSSYNWIEAPTPTIAVPGSPNIWSPPSGARRVKKDTGLIYIAQNAARHPDSPLEPLFRALFTVNPSFDIRAIDVVSDRNNIRKLLSFVDPITSRSGKTEDFTIEVEMTRNTAIFARTETAVQEVIGPHEFRGFGHEFEKAYTKTKVNGSTGCHRIISYRFGNLSFIIRHETDGYVADGRPPANADAALVNEGLASSLSSMSLAAEKSPSKGQPRQSKLTIRRDGRMVPAESILEIKTRVSHRRLHIRDVASQLWVSQTPKLVRAYHTKGIFQPPTVEDVSAEIKAWEDAQKGNLKILAALIAKILGGAKDCGGCAVVRYSALTDKMVVLKAERKKMLPEDLYSKWDEAVTAE